MANKSTGHAPLVRSMAVALRRSEQSAGIIRIRLTLICVSGALAAVFIRWLILTVESPPSRFHRSCISVWMLVIHTHKLSECLVFPFYWRLTPSWRPSTLITEMNNYITDCKWMSDMQKCEIGLHKYSITVCRDSSILFNSGLLVA